MKLRIHIPAALLLFLLCGMPAALAQSLHGYDAATGSDASMWVSLSSYRQINGSTISAVPDDTDLQPIGFDFYFDGVLYSQFCATSQCALFLGDRYPRRYSNNLPITFNINSTPPFMVLYSQFYDHLANGCYIRWGNADAGGHQMLVVEWRLLINRSALDYQTVQLHLLDDGTIRYVYPPAAATISNLAQIGLCFTDMATISVSSGDNSFSSRGQNYMDWPAEGDSYRHFQFAPADDSRCGRPGCDVRHVRTTAAQLYLSPCHAVESCHLSCRPDGNPADSISMDFDLGTADQTVLLDNLAPGTRYSYRLTYSCDNALTAADSGTFTTLCTAEEDNRIDYCDLLLDNVRCFLGTADGYSAPWQHRMDYGPASPISRHTVHTDRTETDPRTGGALTTIPPERCASVRLGNWLNGGESEGIEYAITVDTNVFDHIILRYAIVEEEPGHPAADQPRFNFAINNSEGQLVDSCYFANFIASSNLSGWHRVSGTGGNGVIWCDWTPVGIDIAPLHGQEIVIQLYNADCTMGGHFGYGYFTLEAGSKALVSSLCGAGPTNIFHAPKGFTYRWYLDSDPGTTLSTADSLAVSTPGTYCCHCSYNSALGANCGFTLQATAGPRYPAAAFDITPLDSCSHRVRMDNGSFVASDPELDSLTSERCESYLWRFDDGTTSTEFSPTHTFAPGEHQVELVAMLAGGLCRDSVTHTFTSQPIQCDTLHGTICNGSTYSYMGRQYTQPGSYDIAIDDCHHTMLILDTFTAFVLHIDTMVCEGEGVRLGDTTITHAGMYKHIVEQPGECDSLYLLNLAIRPLPAMDIAIGQVCTDDPYYYIDPAQMADTLRYTWSANPANAPLPRMDSDGLLHITPRTLTEYMLTCQYADAPECPVTDTFDLNGVGPLRAKMFVNPETLSSSQLSLAAYDRSEYAIGRHWIVDSLLQSCEEEVLNYDASPLADSLWLTLVAINGSCTDTVSQKVTIIKHTLYFPSVFTPGSETNNRFGPVWTNISGYHLWIFNRHGALVFRSNDPDQSWDGTFKERPCPQASYVYHCRYTSPTEGPQTLTGTVTLVR